MMWLEVIVFQILDGYCFNTDALPRTGYVCWSRTSIPAFRKKRQEELYKFEARVLSITILGWLGRLRL